MIINKNNRIYGLNLSRLDVLYKKFGLKNKKKLNNSNDLKIIDLEIDTFLKINLMKKEHFVKTNVLNKLKKIENGSYKGYKGFRGLPIFNQRTKTNSRTSRRVVK